MSAEYENASVRFEPDESPSYPVAIGAGVQAAMVIVAPVVLTVVVVMQIAGQTDRFLTWAVFAALCISGITTILQVRSVGRFGSGYLLMMGTSGAFIAVCVAALQAGGPATMASLVVVSSLFQFLMAARLSWLRRLFTPVVSGTVVMLIAATVMPLIFDSLSSAPPGTSSIAAPLASGVTLITIVGLILRAPARLRLWSPVIGVVVGCLVAAPFGLYDMGAVTASPWIGIPSGGWPGLDLTPGVEFWGLLPAFVIATLVGAIETLGDGVAIQRVSHRNPKATDFRAVQGALNADGMGNLLSGLSGTLPNTTYSSSISLAEVTGMASRRVGVALGMTFLAIAFVPKMSALLIAIPPSIAAAYLTVLVGLLFVQGAKIVVRDGLDHRKATVVGISFWVGTAFQNGWVFPDLLGDGIVGTLFGNGMTSGAIFAILMMTFLELTGARRRRLETQLSTQALPELNTFLRKLATKHGWDEASSERLILVGEETLTGLMSEEVDVSVGKRYLRVSARPDGGDMEIEFVSAPSRENLEDQLSYVGDAPDIPEAREISFRLLRHFASRVRHQKYHGVDVVTVTVQGP